MPDTMSSIVKDLWKKLVLWIDWPPPKPRPGIKYVWWEFLGDILDDLTMLTDRETDEFIRRDFSNPDDIRELIRIWILPDFVRYTPASLEKIKNTLAFYLATRSRKLEWVFPSFNIPLDVPSAYQFYTLVWEALYEEPVPVHIDLDKYEECGRLSFINSLEKTMEVRSPAQAKHPYPERKGLILPDRLNRHHANIPLQSLKNRARNGDLPDGTKSIPADAARWTDSADPDYMRQTAYARYQRGRQNGVHISRLTLHFNQTVGEGYLKENPDTSVKTRKARFLFDKLGFLTDCYPLLR